MSSSCITAAFPLTPAPFDGEGRTSSTTRWTSDPDGARTRNLLVDNQAL